jgi:hypothetical protein
MRAPARIVDMKLTLLPLLLLASIGWAFASCGSSEVGDLALILEGEPRVVDITARSARVAATSKFDIVCSVAYGPTKEYGRLATDSDMAAAGHQDHGPLLTGLLPDTEYHLALGGIGPDGTVYRSKDITFRTKLESPGTSLKPRGDNLALLSNGARVVGTSSNFGGGDSSDAWGGDWAIDGDHATQWSSGGDGNDGWIEIELPQRSQISGVGFWTRTMGESAQIYSFQVTHRSRAPSSCLRAPRKIPNRANPCSRDFIESAYGNMSASPPWPLEMVTVYRQVTTIRPKDGRSDSIPARAWDSSDPAMPRF